MTTPEIASKIVEYYDSLDPIEKAEIMCSSEPYGQMLHKSGLFEIEEYGSAEWHQLIDNIEEIFEKRQHVPIKALLDNAIQEFESWESYEKTEWLRDFFDLAIKEGEEAMVFSLSMSILQPPE